MKLNIECVGRQFTAPPFEYDWHQCALYALSIGAGTDDLAYIWEGSKPFRVYPSFAVIPTQSVVLDALKAVNANFRTLVHGAQTVRLNGPVPSSGILTSIGRIREIQDKGQSAIVIVDTETRDTSGHEVFSTSWSIVCIGQGGFGGERGLNRPLPEIESGALALMDTVEKTTDSQALLYRLNGDLNPLHIDPEFANKAGFEVPILHGLCTYGYAMRATINALCDGNPERVKMFSARFSRNVIPGDELRVKAWRSTRNTCIRLQVDSGDHTVLSHGVLELV